VPDVDDVLEAPAAPIVSATELDTGVAGSDVGAVAAESVDDRGLHGRPPHGECPAR
jgi:hypothetical protein